MRSQKGLPVRQAGQVVLILILVMTVALAIGLSVIQRSLSDVSTSSKVEQSSRAFSAAEAGIEKALSGGLPAVINFPDNNSSATVTTPTTDGLIPAIPQGFNRQEALECPPGDSRLAKEDVAQVWLADPKADLPTCTASDICYKQTSLDVYWGSTAATDKAALELTVVYYGTDPNDPDPTQRLISKYRSRKWYLDNNSAGRDQINKFDQVPCTGDYPPLTGYQCKATIAFLPSDLMLLRARLLYNTTSQPFAVQASWPCSLPSGCFIPPQAKVLVSTGTSGQTQRKVQVCQLEKVVPSYFDYAIFSEGDINK
mgnify:CR=1 FL=1